MKAVLFSFFFVLLLLNPGLFAQTDIPQVVIKTLDGKQFNTSEIDNDGKAIILSFWALWCKPCQKELDAFNENYQDWHDETGVKIYAVSIDDSRSTARVMPMVNGKGWEFEVLLDPNGDFKRAMNVNMIPHTFLIDGDGKIVEQHTSYFEGAEYELYEKVKKISGIE
ncbi:MAG: TlpA disulfide reductase family protein [Bacteroidetes bacterium]|jgi:cytochrome c biogenesis protein CcmG/thiol:disulfide interchange protein DsbE|nr:TlpA disulfide reductase family protein [Bacteroidota bacterium]